MVDDNDAQDTTYRTSTPFDPAAGVRLLGEIQAEGLRAAGALVDRLVHLVDGARTAEPDEEEAPERDTTPGPAGVDMGAVLPWFDLWRDLVERTADTVQRLRTTGEGIGEFRVDVDGDHGPVRPLTVEVGPDGRGAAEMWLHNGTAADHAELVPGCGPLTASDGTPALLAVEFDPPKVDGLPSRSSRGFTVVVTAAPETPAGTYRGIVQVTGADAVWMPIEVVLAAVPG